MTTKPHFQSRPTARLSPTIEKTLLAYAAAATAAGVGVLAFASHAAAEIVYTPAHKRLPLNKSLALDLNHDGITDFTLNSVYRTKSFTRYATLTVFPNRPANEIWGHQTSRGILRYASALPGGVQVGSKGQFAPGAKFVTSTTSSHSCHTWLGTHYLGLKFIIKGKAHFGWARLNITCKLEVINATLTGYAYETVPHRSIVTGKTNGSDAVTVQPATLGHLARGAASMAAWRVKQIAGGAQ